MAAAIFEALPKSRPVKGDSRGMVVQFPEPMNQKAEAVLISNGIEIKDFTSQVLEPSDFAPYTLVVTMEQSQKDRLLASFQEASEENTVVLNQIVGEELEIIDPYGGTVQSYGICYEMLKTSITKLIRILEEE